jgi:hypothetical protein
MPIVIHATSFEGLQVVAFAQATVSTTVLALAVPEGTLLKRAWITVEGRAIRYRFDGSDPSSSLGHVAAAGSSLELIGDAAIRNFRMVRQTSNATVTYTVEV